MFCVWVLNHPHLFEVPWTVACKAPLSMEFSRQEYWSGEPFPSPGELSNSGIKPTSLGLLHWQVDSLPLARPGKPLVLQNMNKPVGDFKFRESKVHVLKY